MPLQGLVYMIPGVLREHIAIKKVYLEAHLEHSSVLIGILG